MSTAKTTQSANTQVTAAAVTVTAATPKMSLLGAHGDGADKKASGRRVHTPAEKKQVRPAPDILKAPKVSGSEMLKRFLPTPDEQLAAQMFGKEGILGGENTEQASTTADDLPDNTEDGDEDGSAVRTDPMAQYYEMISGEDDDDLHEVIQKARKKRAKSKRKAQCVTSSDGEDTDSTR